jgi:spore coat polysaccharide biosynthesis protein SpsF (cytidylyltransferase family)
MKIGAIIPVRLSSERLPGKALMDLAGKPSILRLLERVAACGFIDDPRDVVVCTTAEPGDDPLVDVVEGAGYSVYRGETDDIIARLGGAIDAYGFDAVIQADGDDPLSATEYMDATMARLLEDPSLDIVTVTGLPLGCATKAFTRTAMQKVLSTYVTERNDTGFIYFFTKTGVCRHEEIPVADPSHSHVKARLTLDYEDDLKLFRAIFEALERPDGPFGLAEVVAFLNANPVLVEINRHVEAEYALRTTEKAQLHYRDAHGDLHKVNV